MPAAGWYRDPGGSDDLRYWDGDRWTNMLRPVPTNPPDAPPAVARAAAPQAADGTRAATPLTGGARRPRRWRTWEVVGVALVAAALGILIGAGARAATRAPVRRIVPAVRTRSAPVLPPSTVAHGPVLHGTGGRTPAPPVTTSTAARSVTTEPPDRGPAVPDRLFFTQSDSGNVSSRTIDVASATWTLQWRFDCRGRPVAQQTLLVDAVTSGGGITGDAVDVKGATGTGAKAFTDGPLHIHIDVLSQCAWTVNVLGR